jgi:hypothetical protein
MEDEVTGKSLEDWEASTHLVSDGGFGDPSGMTPRINARHIDKLVRIRDFSERLILKRDRDIWSEREVIEMLEVLHSEYDAEFGERERPPSRDELGSAVVPQEYRRARGGWRHYYLVLRFGNRYLDALYPPQGVTKLPRAAT